MEKGFFSPYTQTLYSSFILALWRNHRVFITPDKERTNTVKINLDPSLTFLTLILCLGTSGSLQSQQLTPAERADALKASMAASQAALRHYQWIESTTVSLNGEVKSSVEKRCYYGADGVLQKVEVSAAPQAAPPRGIRGRIVENKKAELTDYMQVAVALVKSYVPPDPAKMQAVKDAGGVSMQPMPSGQVVKLIFQNYEKPGDSLNFEINLANNHPTGLNINTYLDQPSDAVTLNVVMSGLNDGTIYASDITLDAPAKHINVVVRNSGYQLTGN
jgi:hypothetical protein